MCQVYFITVNKIFYRTFTYVSYKTVMGRRADAHVLNVGAEICGHEPRLTVMWSGETLLWKTLGFPSCTLAVCFLPWRTAQETTVLTASLISCFCELWDDGMLHTRAVHSQGSGVSIFRVPLWGLILHAAKPSSYQALRNALSVSPHYRQTLMVIYWRIFFLIITRYCYHCHFINGTVGS